MRPRTALLIDLSSLAHPLYHVSGREPDPDWTSTQTVARVRALASEFPHTAVCADSGRSFRRDLDPSYKATRPEHDAAVIHQIDTAINILRDDGFPVWSWPNCEADDVIASAVAAVTVDPEVEVVVASADKDLLQLVDDRVRVKSLTKGDVYDRDAVWARFHVAPSQFRDYLALVGDASDNIKGAAGIGPKKAAELLGQFATLDNLLTQRLLPQITPGITPAIVSSLKEFATRRTVTEALLTLKTDVPVPIAELWRPRVPVDAAPVADAPQEPPRTAPAAPAAPSATNGAPAEDLVILRSEPAEGGRGLTFANQLEPTTMAEAKQLSDWFFASRMFSAYGSPAGILSTIMAGREFGIPAVSSLRTINNIEGRHAFSAALMVGLALKSGKAEYFRPISVSDTKATFETKRVGDAPFTFSYTIEQAKTAGYVRPGSNWVKSPQDQLVARASSKLARLIYPDVLAGLYSRDELEDAADTRDIA